jgi:hypothetical protein
MKKLTKEKIAVTTKDPERPIILIDWPERAQLVDMYGSRVKGEKLDVYWNMMIMRRDGETLDTIGRFYGVSKERVRQIEHGFIRRCGQFYHRTMTASKLG